MDSSPESAESKDAIFIAEVCAQLNLERNRNSRRKDHFKLPARVYELIEDLGKIDASLACLKTFWHTDNSDYRKASIHLSRLAWDLRKELHEFL